MNGLAWGLPATALAVLAAWSWTAGSEEFGYRDDNGPADWCGLSTDYEACCGDGGKQSPVDIATSAVRFVRGLPMLKFKLPGITSLHAVHNGHTVQANVPEGVAALELNKARYQLLQFHFHTPSEHAVDGVHAPLEMHLVHKTADGSRTAVVGVFIVEGREHKELEKLWAQLPAEEGEEVGVSKFHLHKLLPGKKTSFRYAGSLTTPPCTEGVAWNLLSTPITMSRAQIEKFQSVFSGGDFPEGNARPAQPLEGRMIATDVR